ncbi:MAG: PAS domain S-box protein [Taibaiella sp.]|nr:PAS domain S-box protein [Taibaiella sp.]
MQLVDTEIVITTLLRFSALVAEFGKDGSVLSTWYNSEQNSLVGKLDIEEIARQFRTEISACFDDGTYRSGQLTAEIDGQKLSFEIKFLPSTPGPGRLVATAEIASKHEEVRDDEFWEDALDASGDGRWDVFIPDLRIGFSRKWHSHFGYSPQSLTTIDQWVGLIHPHDVDAVQKARLDYFEGRTRIYNNEFRLLCEGGEYRWVLSRGVIVKRDSDGKPLRFTGTHTDIHERKLTEERYASTAQLLAKLINNLHEGILVTDEHKKIVYANEMFCELYDIGEAPEALVGLDAYKSIASRKSYYADPEYFFNRTVEILENREPVLNEEWKMLGGKTLNRDFIPLTFGNNSKGGIWKFRDITDQKTVEKQLADLRNFYERILNSIAADIVVYDSKNRYVFINPTAVKNAEIRQWLLGKTDADYARLRNKSYEFVEQRQAILQRAREERKEIEWEETVATPDGGTEYHIRYMYPVFDEAGNHQFGVGYGFNITDRVKAQQELKTSMGTFASAFNESGIGMALLDTNGKWIDMNRVLCTMTGYSKEELHRVPFRDITHPDDLDLDAHEMKQLWKGLIPSYSVEKRYISRFNKIIQVLLTVSLVRDSDGNPRFYIAQVVDITEKKELEWTLHKKIADLEVTRENLLAKIHQLEDLSHIVAHNLRGPAGNIKVIAEAMLGAGEDAGSPTDEAPSFTQEEAMLLIHEGSSALMESLATLMRITEIKLNKEIPRDHCDINAMINDICNQLQGVIFEKKALILRDLDVPYIHYPRMYLENVLYNLLSNSLKYTRPGVRPEILVLTQHHDGRTKLTIKDNGLGIDMERYGHRVFKLNEVFHSGFDSKGVGLYLTKTQVESYGGSIELKSKPNEGCEFVVTL